MMASQPANTEISVYRRVRAQVEARRHDPVNIIGRIRPKIIAIPAEEVRVIETRDSLITDAQSVSGNRLGHPLVRYLRPELTPANVLDNVTGLDFPVRLTNSYRDLFVQKSAANLGDDLQSEVRAL